MFQFSYVHSDENLASNQKCPCGSGKFYEQCHGVSGSQQDEALRAAGCVIDPENNSNLIISSLVVVNQLRREAPKIAASFDDLYKSESREISHEMSKIWGILQVGFQAKLGEPEKTHFLLLLNSWQSLMASLGLLREGFTLQPGILLRNVLETISTVFYLLQNPQENARFRSGKLQSQRTIEVSKKLFPHFGLLYGKFSEWFTHLGEVHTWLHATVPYESGNKAVITNLAFIRMAVWFHLIASEATFLRFIANPRYWSKNGKGELVYDPTERELKWLRTFLRNLPDDAQDQI